MGAPVFRINRNIVECKSLYIEFLVIEYSKVLIETLWNVNLFEGYSYTDIGSVLIETLWNVNMTDKLPCSMRRLPY